MFAELVPKDGAQLMDKSMRGMLKNEYKDDIALGALAMGSASPAPGVAVVPPDAGET